ncbi:hypothetical protein [Pseudoalteromonas sp. XMcav11-Q]|uniref:DUF4760 domain-containing protein n=1 Tax=Pseudoalteromonas sp. XMcav11-Q TaxID=3136665 RepID=UPI0032C3D61B
MVGKDCAKRALLLKAYSFHSFNEKHLPNIHDPQGLDGPSAINYSHLSFTNFRIYVPLVVMIVIITVLLSQHPHPFSDKQLLSSLIISVSAIGAYIGVTITIRNNRKISSKTNTINALDKLWKSPEGRVVSRQKAKMQINPDTSFHDALNKLRLLQKKIELDDGLSKREKWFHLSVLGAQLALANEKYPFIEKHRSDWQSIFEQYGLERNCIRVGLNEAEGLCQGIKLELYDEALVKERIGADICSVVIYLLPYIYTIREVHAVRLNNRLEHFKYIEFADRGRHYQGKADSNDLYYEHVEYYCYKWFFSEAPKSFSDFHQHLINVYEDIGNFYGDKKPESVDVHSPFIEALKLLQTNTLDYLVQRH